MQIQTSVVMFKRAHTPRTKTNRIVVHHSASGKNTTILDIQSWHLTRGWYGVGYHYVIYPDGTVVQGRPDWAKGAHAYQDRSHDANSDGIGICLIGNFEEYAPTSAQIDSLVELIKMLRKLYSNLKVQGHKDVMPTACPGRLFPWAELNKRLEENNVADPIDWKVKAIKEAEKIGILMPNVHSAEEPADKGFVAAVAVNLLKLIKGGDK